MPEESKYLKYLPSVYREDGDGVQEGFMGRFLQAFEEMLEGAGSGSDPAGVHTLVEDIANYFDPDFAPAQFIDWLAGWVALELQQTADWMEDDYGETTAVVDQVQPFAAARDTRNRNLIKNAASLYQKRGTRNGMQELLAIYAKLAPGTPPEDIEKFVRIIEATNLFQIGVTTIIGTQTSIGERPHYFQVEIVIPAPDPVALTNYKRSVANVIDAEKPAHTYYDLIVTVPTMQVGETATVGVDTLLGTTTEAPEIEEEA